MGFPRKVLVIDRSQTLRETVADLIRSAGIMAVEAGDADEAKRHLRNIPFDAMLSDISAYRAELAQEVQELRPAMPVILMSASEAPPDPAEVFGYLAKPFHREELLGVLKRSFES
jgi:DNA-binding NtrC family response regulator